MSRTKVAPQGRSVHAPQEVAQEMCDFEEFLAKKREASMKRLKREQTRKAATEEMNDAKSIEEEEDEMTQI